MPKVVACVVKFTVLFGASLTFCLDIIAQIHRSFN